MPVAVKDLFVCSFNLFALCLSSLINLFLRFLCMFLSISHFLNLIYPSWWVNYVPSTWLLLASYSEGKG